MGRGKAWTAVEDALLRDLVGKVAADQMALVLGHPIGGVRYRMKKLGLKGYLTGEYHWSSKMSNLLAGSVGVLYDAGYTPAQIHRVLTEQPSITREHIGDICRCRYRARSAA